MLSVLFGPETGHSSNIRGKNVKDWQSVMQILFRYPVEYIAGNDTLSLIKLKLLLIKTIAD